MADPFSKGLDQKRKRLLKNVKVYQNKQQISEQQSKRLLSMEKRIEKKEEALAKKHEELEFIQADLKEIKEKKLEKVHMNKHIIRVDNFKRNKALGMGISRKEYDR
jgi:hypothetical protein